MNTDTNNRKQPALVEWKPSANNNDTDNEEDDIIVQLDVDVDRDPDAVARAHGDLERKARAIRDLWNADMKGWAELANKASTPRELATYNAYYNRSMTLRNQEIAKLGDPSIEVKYPMKGVDTMLV